MLRRALRRFLRPLNSGHRRYFAIAGWCFLSLSFSLLAVSGGSTTSFAKDGAGVAPGSRYTGTAECNWVVLPASSAQPASGVANSGASEATASKPSAESQNPEQREARPADNDISPRQLWELGGLAAFGMIALVIQMCLLRKAEPKPTPADVVQISVVTIIVTFSAATLIMGFNEKQIVPVVGLYGSVIGYLLGRSERLVKKRGNNESPRPAPSPRATGGPPAEPGDDDEYQTRE